MPRLLASAAAGLDESVPVHRRAAISDIDCAQDGRTSRSA
jgi:hypothetical protein